MELLDWLPADWWARLFLGLIPPLLLALAKLLFRSKQPHAALTGKIQTQTFIDEASTLPLLEVRYDDIRVANLKLTTALLWNSGRDPIRRDEIAKQAPLGIRLPEDTRIWEATLLWQTKEGNAAQIAIQENSVAFEFDFLNPNDALLIQVLHTGELGEANLEGNLIGSTTAVKSTWEHQLGVHGPLAAGHNRIVNWRLLGALGSVINILFVSIIVLAFAFATWWPVLLLGTLLFVSSVYNLWPTSDLPRTVKRDLKTFLEDQQQAVEST